MEKIPPESSSNSNLNPRPFEHEGYIEETIKKTASYEDTVGLNLQEFLKYNTTDVSRRPFTAGELFDAITQNNKEEFFQLKDRHVLQAALDTLTEKGALSFDGEKYYIKASA